MWSIERWGHFCCSTAAACAVPAVCTALAVFSSTNGVHPLRPQPFGPPANRPRLPTHRPPCSSKLVHDLRGHAGGVLCHQQSGTQLATGGADCALRLWDLRAGKAQAVVPLGSLPYCLQVGRGAAV